MTEQILRELKLFWPAVESKFATTIDHFRRKSESPPTPTNPCCITGNNSDSLTTDDNDSKDACPNCLMPSVLLHHSNYSLISSPLPTPTDSVDVPEDCTLRNGSVSDLYGNSLSPLICGWTEGYGNQSVPSQSSDDMEDHYDTISSNTNDDTSLLCENSSSEDFEDYEVLSFDQPIEHSLYIQEFVHTTAAEQNFKCICCKRALPPSSNERRCYYYGNLYCNVCHKMDTALIPAKIIHHYNTKKYPVCRRAKYIIDSNSYYPLLDVQNDNPKLYKISKLLHMVKLQRIQLKALYNYLATCSVLEKDNVLIEDTFFRDLWPRDHLYQSVHTYSLQDIVSLKKIHALLRDVIANTKAHVLNCVLCSQKGHFCEICKNRTEILYPFDDYKLISRCQICASIYHQKCYLYVDKDCPKCYRCWSRAQHLTDDDS